MKRKDLWILLGALTAAVVLGLSQFLTQTVPTVAWGLHFSQLGQPPSGPVSAQQLARLDGVFLGDTQQKVLYLTFDAGYENGCTEKILQVLEDHQVPAAFFLVGDYIQKNPDLVRKMVAQGHIVGNHTMDHPDMAKIRDPAAFQAQLEGVEALYQSVTGAKMPKYYRPPQGVYSEENLQMAKDLGYKTVLWSLAYADWNNDAQPTPEQAFSKLLPRVHNGAVVLLHSTSATNAQILDALLTQWKAEGYRFESIQQLFPDPAYS